MDDPTWYVDMLKKSMKDSKGQITTEELVDLYKNTPRESLDKYRERLTGKVRSKQENQELFDRMHGCAVRVGFVLSLITLIIIIYAIL